MGGLLISKSPDENWVLSLDGSRIYVAGNDGNLHIFDALTGALIQSVDVGFDLDAIALSPDGTTLAITEAVARNVEQSDNWPTNTADVDVYAIDIATLEITRHTHQATGYELIFGDVAFADNDTLHLTQRILPGWSGWSPLTTLDLGSGAFGSQGSYYASGDVSSSLTASPSDESVLLGMLDLSSAQYYFIGENGAQFDNNGVYENGVFGGAPGVEAISGTGPSGRIAIFTAGRLHLYDGRFTYLFDLTPLASGLEQTAGIAFSEDGSLLYALDSQNDRVIVIDVQTLSLSHVFPLAAFEGAGLKWGDELVLSPDGQDLYHNGAAGIYSAHVFEVVDGTAGSDNLRGTQSHDLVSGLAGDDILRGVGEDDLLQGGTGHDLLYGGTGNDVLNGGDGDDVLQGGTGDDAMAGGAGNDLYRINSAGDTVTELVGEGTDEVRGSLPNYVMPDNVEVLRILAGNYAAAGNALDNSIFGSNGNNAIAGLGGNDTLLGGGGLDVLSGNAGDDVLVGGAGRDLLAGGAGADRFAFLALSDSTPGPIHADVITDFNRVQGDRIQLGAIDAIAGGANDPFAFIGSAAFSGTAGELRYRFDGGNTLVEMDVDGDGVRDMTLVLTGSHALVAGDFIL